MAENATTIDNLQIKVEAASTDAIKSLESLKGTLEDLAKYCEGGAGLDHYIKDLKELDSEAGKTASGKLKELAKALKDLQGVGKLNMTEAADGIEKVAKSGEKAASSLAKTGIKLTAAYASIRKIGTVVAKLIYKSNTYVEDLNLFNASLGQYASSAKEYAETVGDLMGIDPANWMRSQGIFQTLAEGFGIASDRAIIMSKNLTQLGYDLSSFFNIAVEGQGGAMQKLQAAISGELEPIRRLGYDLSEARLKAIALSLGIEQAFNTMTQAQKAQLRYYALLTQVTTAQGDMARTLNAPANQLRVLKAQVEMAARSLGNIFIPALNAVLPYITAFVQAVREIAQAIAEAFDFQLPEIDYSGIEKGTTVIDDMDDSLQKAGGSAKKLNELLADWDELNIIQSEAGGGGGRGSAYTDYGDWAFELPEYDFLKGLVDSKVTGIFEKLKPYITWVKDNAEEIKSLVLSIGDGFLLWKLSRTLLGEDFNWLESWFGRLTEAAAGIGVAYLGITLNTKFTNKWLNEKDWGALLGGTATDIMSSTLAGKLVEKALKGKPYAYDLGKFTRGMTLVIMGGTTMRMALDDFDTKGLTVENALALVKGGAEMGVGLGAVVEALAKMAFGTSLSAKDLVVPIGILTLGAGVSMKLSNNANNAREEGNTGKMILNDAMRIGSDILTSSLSGLTVAKRTGNAKLGWTVTGLGMTLDAGIETVNLYNNVKESGATTLGEALSENIDSVILSSVEYGISGATIGMAIGGPKGAIVGGLIGLVAGALLSVGVSELAIHANESALSQQKVNITWGTTTLTQEQLEAKISSYFTFDIKAKVNSLTFYADSKTTLVNNVSNKIASIPFHYNNIVLGLNVADSQSAITSALIGADGSMGQGTLVGDMIELIKTNAIPISSLFNLDGKLGADEKNVLENVNWLSQDLTGRLTELGDTWGKYVTSGFAEELKQGALEAIKEMTAITSAYMRGQNKAQLDVYLAGTDFSSLDKESALGVLSGYQGRRNEVWDAYKKQADDAYTAQIALINAEKERLSFMTEGSAEYTALEARITQLEGDAAAKLTNIQNGYENERTIFEADMKESDEQLYRELFQVGYEQKGGAMGFFLSGIWNHGTSGEKNRLSDILALEDPQSQQEIYSIISQYVQNYSDAIRDEMVGWFGSDFVEMIPEGVDIGEYLTQSLYEYVKTQAEWLARQPSENTNNTGSDEIWNQFYSLLKPEDIFQADQALINTYDSLTQKMETLSTYTYGSDEYEELRKQIELQMEAYTQYANDLQNNPLTPTLDTSGVETGYSTMTADYDSMIKHMNDTGVVSIRMNPSTVFPNFRFPKIVFRAEGGFPDTGELFVAREAGAELVGTIGRRTAVANNDQIESGIAGGVREANSEQNELLRQQNAYLRAILAKTGRAVIEPSTALARTVKRSNELLTQANG